MSHAFTKIVICTLALIAVSVSGCSVLTGQVGSLSITDKKIGNGALAVRGARVSVDYTGWIFDPRKSDKKGRHFDTTVGEEPFNFLLGARQVIKGWDLGVKGMKIGGERTLIIPPELAYGRKGTRGIPPESTLLFEIRLVDVNGQKSGFVVTDDKVGTGAKVGNLDWVQVHYTGWLYDVAANDKKGKKFDTSIGVKPFKFRAGGGRVIVGWAQGVIGLQEGGQRTLIIPANMAYGEKGAGEVIPPDAKLIFEVELIRIN
jgi:peptidylprolyl isomerase